MLRKSFGFAIPVVLVALLATVVVWPPPVQRAEAWLRYRVTGYVPPPIVVGRNDRLFLGNHPGNPPGSLIADVCGTSVKPGDIDNAAKLIRPILDAGKATGLPFRLLIVPTAPRIYPEDLPAGTPCSQPGVDRLVAALADPAVDYPVAFMQGLKPRFDVLPRHHFHWAGEGPLRVAEQVSDSMGLARITSLPLRSDNRASDLNGFDPGLGVHDRIGTPNLRAAGIEQCDGSRCTPALPPSIVQFSRTGPQRILVIADSFGDEIGGDFGEYAGVVWLVRMNLALSEPPGLLAPLLHEFRPDAVVVVYHDAGALALDPGSQASLALAASLIGNAGLSSGRGSP